MKEYVVGFLFHPSLTQVTLIRKNRPGWQAGKLNGVGGKVEVGETPDQAMAREFHEETGWSSPNWVRYIVQSGLNFRVHYFFQVSQVGFDQVKTRTDELVGRYVINDLMVDELVPHVYWMLQCCITWLSLVNYDENFPQQDSDRYEDSYVIAIDRMRPNRPEPPPRPGDGKPVWDLVIQDMRDRDQVGRERYGMPLQAHNGRDALVDAYQEVLDAAVYLRQEIEERNYGTVIPGLNKILPWLKE